MTNSALPAEVYKAAGWWRRQLEQSGKVSTESASAFETSLVNLLREKVVGHWFTDKPWRGQGHSFFNDFLPIFHTYFRHPSSYNALLRTNSKWQLRSLMLDRMSARPDPLLRKAATSAAIENIFDCFPIHLEQVTMWIDPGEVVIKLWWSYFQRGVEEVIYRSPSLPPQQPQQPQPSGKPLSVHGPLSNTANEYQPNFITSPGSPPPQHYHVNTPPTSNRSNQTQQMYSWSPKSPGFTVTA